MFVPCSWRYPVVEILSDNRRRTVRRKRSRAPLRYRIEISPFPYLLSWLALHFALRMYVLTYAPRGESAWKLMKPKLQLSRDPIFGPYSHLGPQGENIIRNIILSFYFNGKN